ncbi:MAG TPA: GNAT family N-acetyltransferase [Caulobacter sp.]|nr:GNAT family N-acetyltransferase [Caulobacter sp.]
MCMIEISPTIETRRLTLRSPAPADAPRLATLMNDVDIARMTSRVPHPYALSDAERFVGLAQGEDPRTDRSFLIELEDEGVIGGIGFNAAPNGRTEVGYWLGRDWWGRGLATEALQGALAWAGRDWRKRFIVAGHFADNPASGQVLVKAGFLYTGEVQARPSIARGGEASTRMMVWLA